MKSLRNQVGVSVHMQAHYVATANPSVARLYTYMQICICIRICPDSSKNMQDLSFQGRTRMSTEQGTCTRSSNILAGPEFWSSRRDDFFSFFFFFEKECLQRQGSP
eukprot:jgi/Botrbrau1/2276/Bobra.101_2s0099.1